MEDKKDIIYTCTNPQIVNRSLFCDGNCWNCGYHQPLQDRIGDIEIINDGESYTKGYKAAFEWSYNFSNSGKTNPGWRQNSTSIKKLTIYKKWIKTYTS